MPVTYCNDPADPQVRERIREEWSKVLLEHEKQVAEREIVKARWAWEDEQHAALLREWKDERIQHEQESKERARREEEHHETVREEWAKEAEQHRHKLEEMERREKQRQENERQKWQREVEDHNRIEEERQKREAEERERLKMFWGQVEAHTCTTYATREYTAQLKNLPATWEHRVEACKATPLEVHGISYLPTSCEDKVRNVNERVFRC